MTIDRRDVGRIVKDLKAAGTDTQDVEVKESVRKLPSSIVETLSAFSNTTGGTLILGLSEKNGFAPAPGFQAKPAADSLATVCSTKLTPPVRPEIDFADYGGAQVVVARIPEFVPRDKPCYATERGVYHGSYVRVADGDRRMTPYEIDRLMENRSQPTYDAEPVAQARFEDLDASLVNAVLARQRQLHPRIFAALSDEDALASLHVITRDDGKPIPTLAGLLALGTYPQSIFPRLTVAFTAYGPNSSYQEKYLDAQTMAGPMPAVLEDTLSAVRRNMRVAGVLDPQTQLRRDAPEFPLAAVREVVANALMHRDYSPASRGTAVQVSLHPDRLEVVNPGGLYGTLTIEDLGTPGYSSTRNQFLSSLLESVPFLDGYMVENRGTGWQLIQQELARAGMPDPEVADRTAMFSVTMRNAPAAANPSEINPGMVPNDSGTPTPHAEVQHDEVYNYLSTVTDASAAEIAHATGLARSTVSYRLRKLASKGVVARTGELRSPKQRYHIIR